MQSSPHVNVKNDNHILGVSFFKTRLLGISLFREQAVSVCAHKAPQDTVVSQWRVLPRNVHGNVERIECSKSRVILVIGHVEVGLKIV